MFTCKKCTDKAEGKGHYNKHSFLAFDVSYGPCEICKRVRNCVDCKCYKKRPRKA